MTPPENLVLLSRNELLAVIAALQRQIAEHQHQIAALTARNTALQAEIERLTRDTKRRRAGLRSLSYPLVW